jgi:hypothetical protein
MENTVRLIAKWFCRTFLLQTILSRVFFAGTKKKKKNSDFHHCAFYTGVIRRILEVLGFQVTRRDKMKLCSFLFFVLWVWGSGNLRGWIFFPC